MEKAKDNAVTMEEMEAKGAAIAAEAPVINSAERKADEDVPASDIPVDGEKSETTEG